ncbi:MAG: cytidine deaminase [Firmicutes bacterium]|nr:cytidine deaminase [Bacillota bacterium]
MKEYTPRQVKEDPELIRRLYRDALKATENAFAPFSHFHVGAALLTRDGRIFTGVNVENSSYGATICAERTALVKAISEGARTFAAIAVVSQDGEAWPCGICRQVLYEFSPDMLVITGRGEKALETAALEELLPHGFRL